MVSPTKSLPTARERTRPADSGSALVVALSAIATALLLAVGIAIVALTSNPTALGSANAPLAHKAAPAATQAVVAGDPDQN